MPGYLERCECGNADIVKYLAICGGELFSTVFSYVFVVSFPKKRYTLTSLRFHFTILLIMMSLTDLATLPKDKASLRGKGLATLQP